MGCDFVSLPVLVLPCVVVDKTTKLHKHMKREEWAKRLVYREALKMLPELSVVIKAVFRKALGENLPFDAAGRAIGTEEAIRAGYLLRRLHTYCLLLPFYYEELMEKARIDSWLDNDDPDYDDYDLYEN